MFDALFFGEFVEKRKDEVEIKEVVYEVSDKGTIALEMLLSRSFSTFCSWPITIR